ncbi:MAG: sugar ABC transporter permease [Clostridiales bacterium]|nr:sugar ABC transporter permease [Clostridiales bacterium]
MKRKGISYAKYGYLFSLPFVLAYAFFMLYPIIYTVILGFTDLKGAAATTWKFLDEPFTNFEKILNNKTFITSLENTFVIWIINFIPQLSLALLLTAWFTRRKRTIHGQGLFKVMFYLPNIITAATVAILFNSFFGYPVGPVNTLLKALGAENFYFTNDKWASKLIVAFIQFWQWYGYTAIVLISGVLGINPTLFESAEIDGATPAQTFFRITLPCMRTILIYSLITSLIGGLTMFDIPKLFNNGGPVNATSTASVFIHKQAFEGTYQYNRASAASVVLFLIVAVLSVMVFFLMRDRYDAKEKRLNKKLARTARKGKEGINV